MKVGDYVLADFTGVNVYCGQIVIEYFSSDTDTFGVQIFGVSRRIYTFNRNNLTVITPEEAMLRKLES